MYIAYTMKNAAELTRTQIYLTQQQQARLTQVSHGSAVTKSALIREAVDQFLDKNAASKPTDKVQQLQSIAGLWATHDDKGEPADYVRRLRQPRTS
jgi:predicted transcriptional regulator